MSHPFAHPFRSYVLLTVKKDLESAITSNLQLELAHTPTIYTNVVVSNVDGCSPELAQVHPIDWERLWALHAWDFVYVSVNGKVKGGAGLVHTVRVSKGRWRVEG